MKSTIHCPKCGQSFEPSVLMRQEALAEARAAMQAELDARAHAAEAELRSREEALDKSLGDARAREAALLKKQRELEDRSRELDLDVERRVAVEARRICDREAKALQERMARDTASRLEQKEAELAETRTKLDAAESRELLLLKKEREIEERERRASLELERKLADATRKIREEEARVFEQRAAIDAEQQALREAEHKQTIESLQKSLAEAQRKVLQGSQQTQGEAQEAVLRDMLAQAFDEDAIEDVPKGVNGADLLQRVRAPDGTVCGVIAWESKRTKAWSDGWLPKLRDDQRLASASCAVLVTQTLPKDIQHFGLKDGVWVCGWAYAPALAAALRVGLVSTAHARRAAEGRGEKMQMLYEYLTGAEFKNRVGGFVEAFKEMQEDLEHERMAMQKLWKRRERQLLRARDNITAFYGDLQGIAGHKLGDLPALALEPAEPRNGSSALPPRPSEIEA